MQKFGPPNSQECVYNNNFAVLDYMIQTKRLNPVLKYTSYFQILPGERQKSDSLILTPHFIFKTCRRSAHLHKTKGIVLFHVWRHLSKDFSVRENVRLPPNSGYPDF